MTVDEFLGPLTPQAWCEMASKQLDLILLDHAHCEKKAASTALNLMYRYPQHTDLIYRLSRFAREELRHFEQVLKIMQSRGVALQHLAPSRYAGTLHKQISTSEPRRLVDTLLVSAFIEARSCERFRVLMPYLDDELAKFYGGLYAAEERHFTTYLAMARQHASLHGIDAEARIRELRVVENDLVVSADSQCRFHSGPPARLEVKVALG